MGISDAVVRLLQQFQAFLSNSTKNLSPILSRAISFDQAAGGKLIDESRDSGCFFKHSAPYLQSRQAVGSPSQNAQNVVLRHRQPRGFESHSQRSSQYRGSAQDGEDSGFVRRTKLLFAAQFLSQSRKDVIFVLGSRHKYSLHDNRLHVMYIREI